MKTRKLNLLGSRKNIGSSISMRSLAFAETVRALLNSDENKKTLFIDLIYTKQLLEQLQKQIKVKKESLKEDEKIETQLIKDQIDLLEEFYNKNK